jgi:hypothetical protein
MCELIKREFGDFVHSFRTPVSVTKEMEVTQKLYSLSNGYSVSVINGEYGKTPFGDDYFEAALLDNRLEIVTDSPISALSSGVSSVSNSEEIIRIIEEIASLPELG